MNTDTDAAVTERIIEWGLHEQLGGERPPDLRARVLARSASGAWPEPEPAAAAGTGARASWLAFALCAAGVAAAAATVICIDEARAPQRAAQAAQDPASRPAPDAEWRSVATVEDVDRVGPECRALRLEAAHEVLLARVLRQKGLERLALDNPRSDAGALDEAALRAIAACKTLRELRLDRPEIEPAWLQQVQELPLLETLSLSFTPVGKDGAAILAKLPSLRRLEIAYDDTLDDQALEYLCTLPGLRFLALRACGALTAEGLRSLAKLTRLESLDLRTTNGTRLGPRGAPKGTPLATLVQMRELELRFAARPGGGGVDDTVLAALAKLKGLRELRLGGCVSVTHAGIAAVAALPLRVLELPGGSGGELREIVSALPPGLEAVSCAWCVGLDDAALEILARRLPRLREADLRMCTRIGDAGLAALLAGCELERLELAGCTALTVASTEGLLGEKSLQVLDVSGLGWVDAAAEAKLRALPALRELVKRPGGVLPAWNRALAPR